MSNELIEKLGDEGVLFLKNNVDQFFRVLKLLAAETENQWDDLALQLIADQATKMVKEL